MDLTKVLVGSKKQFNQLSKEHLAVKFEQECTHALFLLKQNDFLKNMAEKNPDSLQMALYQVASTGLSLNPSKRHGYLVPYGGKSPRVAFMPSYMGLCHLAMESGSIKWVKAEIVYEGDIFEYNGPEVLPTHKFDPFGENKTMEKAKGVYCVAKTVDGEYLTEMMSKGDVYGIRNRSEAFKSGKKVGPWFTDEGEMWKKTVIRRAEKLWPKTERFSKAVEILNENDGLSEAVEPPTEYSIATLEEMIQKIPGDTELRLLNHVNEKFQASFSEIDEFGSSQVEYSINFLSQFVR